MIEITVPSKTFVLGEYSVLKGGTALMINTLPVFRFAVETRKENEDISHAMPDWCHPESPAGQWWNQHLECFQNYRIEFHDPHPRGGWGASSAQFLALDALYHYHVERLYQLDPWKTLEEYLSFMLSNLGHTPSGTDILSQSMGAWAIINPTTRYAQSVAWPFLTEDLLLVSLSKKTTTHVHLAELSQLNVEALEHHTQAGLNAFREGDVQAFSAAITDFQNELIHQNLIAENTMNVLEQVREWPGVLAAKGCGALGADVLLLLIEQNKREHIEEALKKLQLAITTDQHQLAAGVRLHLQKPLPETLSSTL